MNLKLNAICASILALSCGAANAAYLITTNPGVTTTMVGNVCTVDFNSAASVTACPATFSAPGGILSHVVTGDSPGQYANPANDPTPYLTVGGNLAGPIVLTLATPGDYFGFYAGSVDSYNSVTFSLGSVAELTLTGNDINRAIAGTNANQGTNAYFNIFTSFTFDTVSLSSSSAAFETDNHAFGTASPVPEPASVSLLGLGALGLLAARRRRK